MQLSILGCDVEMATEMVKFIQNERDCVTLRLR
ncbi:MAG: hypothetical protein RLZZ512_331 [Bacteroidota bacterium]